MKFIEFLIKVVYITMIVYISKEDFKNKRIDKKIIVYGSIISIIYMIHETIIKISNVYMNIIYLIIYILLFMTDTYILRKYAQESYLISLLTMLNIILVFTGFNIFIKTILVAITAIIIYSVINKIRKIKKKNIQYGKNIALPLGFFIGASNILTLLVDILIKI